MNMMHMVQTQVVSRLACLHWLWKDCESLLFFPLNLREILPQREDIWPSLAPNALFII